MRRMLRWLLTMMMVAGVVSAADRLVVVPKGGPPPVGPYSPGIVIGGYLYVSGQGARAPEGKRLDTFEDKARQCLENVKSIVVEAGLTMEHIVYAQVYLTDMANMAVMDRVWRSYFPRNAPARAVVGVNGIPADNPIEITVVAVRDLAEKKVVELPGGEGRAVLTADRLYLAATHGRDLSTGKVPADAGAEVETALRRAEKVLEAAGLGLEHMVFINPYLTGGMPMRVMNRVYASHFEFGNTPARATIRMAGLPGESRFELTGVAVRHLSQ
ncbi:MAG: RidA family protein, partial [bacterium]|nr:RidA family protein [bacterium]